MAPFLTQILRDNDLRHASYAEPYCGGAGAALTLLFNNVIDSVYLNDLDPAIYAFWHMVVHDATALCDTIANTPVTIDTWYAQRHTFLQHRTRVSHELAFAMFFLSRTNRAGILGAGPMGGRTQAGRWRLDDRFNKEVLIRKIQRIASYAPHIQVSHLDATVFLHDVVNPLPSPTLVYLDPPYFVQGQHLYTCHYQPNDHVALATFVHDTLNKPWVISYDRHPTIEQLYGMCERVEYGKRYSAQARYFGRELLVVSSDLTMPSLADPLSTDRKRAQQRWREKDVAQRALLRPRLSV